MSDGKLGVASARRWPEPRDESRQANGCEGPRCHARGEKVKTRRKIIAAAARATDIRHGHLHDRADTEFIHGHLLSGLDTGQVQVEIGDSDLGRFGGRTQVGRGAMATSVDGAIPTDGPVGQPGAGAFLGWSVGRDGDVGRCGGRSPDGRHPPTETAASTVHRRPLRSVRALRRTVLARQRDSRRSRGPGERDPQAERRQAAPNGSLRAECVSRRSAAGPGPGNGEPVFARNGFAAVGDGRPHPQREAWRAARFNRAAPSMGISAMTLLRRPFFDPGGTGRHRQMRRRAD